MYFFSQLFEVFALLLFYLRMRHTRVFMAHLHRAVMTEAHPPCLYQLYAFLQLFDVSIALKYLYTMCCSLELDHVWEYHAVICLVFQVKYVSSDQLVLVIFIPAILCRFNGLNKCSEPELLNANVQITSWPINSFWPFGSLVDTNAPGLLFKQNNYLALDIKLGS